MASNILTAFEDQITCKICLEIYEHPCELDCRHTICLTCYSRIYADKGSVSCPLCRKVTNTEPNDVSIDEKVVKFVETYRELETSVGTGRNVAKTEDQSDKCTELEFKDETDNERPIPKSSFSPENYQKQMDKLTESFKRMAKLFMTKTDDNSNFSKRVTWLCKEIGALDIKIEKVGEVFRHLEKIVRAKREELEIDLDERKYCFMQELQELEAKKIYFDKEYKKLNDLVSSGDFQQFRYSLKSFEGRLNAVNVDHDEAKVGTDIQTSLESLTSMISSDLEQCQVVDVSEASNESPQVGLVCQRSFPAKISCISMMTNTQGYCHDPSATCPEDPLDFGIKGCIIKKGESEQERLPDKVIILSFQVNSSFLYVFDFNGKPVSRIPLTSIKHFDCKSVTIFACESVSQSILVSNCSSPDVHQLKPDGQSMFTVRCKGVLHLAVASNPIADYTKGVLVVQLIYADVIRTQDKCEMPKATSTYVNTEEHIESFYSQIHVYEITESRVNDRYYKEGKTTPLLATHLIVTDMTCTFTTLFVLSPSQINIIDIHTERRLRTVSLPGMITTTLIEITAGPDERFVFLKGKDSKVYRLNFMKSDLHEGTETRKEICASLLNKHLTPYVSYYGVSKRIACCQENTLRNNIFCYLVNCDVSGDRITVLSLK